MGRTKFALGFRSLVARLVPFKRGGTKRAKKLWQWKCELMRISAPQWWPLWREKRTVRIFGKGSVSLSPIVRIFGKQCVNSSPILARQWWRHFRLSLSLSLYLSLSLSLSPKVPHAQYRKRFRASYNTERERERRKWRHHCRAKIGDEFCTSPCQKCGP